MIENRLRVIAAERYLKITKISNDTGISRTTLTAMSNNTAKRIDYETINTLCKYLHITPNELFIYKEDN